MPRKSIAPPPRVQDLTGKRFGRLVVIGYAFARRPGKRSGEFRTRRLGRYHHWLCLCDCGQEKAVCRDALSGGQTRSCGCLNSELSAARVRTHGQYGTPTYISWRNMKRRCLDPKDADYHRYGGRGIKVCRRWLDFRNFLKDMGQMPDGGYTIERRDVNGHYTPRNCCWLPSRLQAQNRRNNRLLSFCGRTQCLAAWAREVGMRPPVLADRLNRYGWSVEKALTTPARICCRR